jgi:hypothetical protein
MTRKGAEEAEQVERPDVMRKERSGARTYSEAVKGRSEAKSVSRPHTSKDGSARSVDERKPGAQRRDELVNEAREAGMVLREGAAKKWYVSVWCLRQAQDGE